MLGSGRIGEVAGVPFSLDAVLLAEVWEEDNRGSINLSWLVSQQVQTRFVELVTLFRRAHAEEGIHAGFPILTSEVITILAGRS